jgi:hypothetical protein
MMSAFAIEVAAIMAAARASMVRMGGLLFLVVVETRAMQQIAQFIAKGNHVCSRIREYRGGQAPTPSDLSLR